MKKVINNYKFKQDLPFEFEILSVNDLYNKHKTIITVPHRADFYHIIWVTKGEAKHFIDFTPIKMKANSILFIPKNSVSFFDSSGKYEGEIILFTDNFFCKNDSDIRFLNSTILFSDLYEMFKLEVKKKSSDLGSILSAIKSENNTANDFGKYDILRNMLHNFLLLSERQIKEKGFKEVTPSVKLDKVLLFKNSLEKNYKSEKSVQKYADELSLTEKQLYRITLKILGKTPKQIITERVLLEAKRLLVHSSLNVKEIAYELGFDEPTHFVKYFQKQTKSTPTVFKSKFS